MSDATNPLGTVQPAAAQPPAKESFAQKTKIFFEHVWSFFNHDAKAFETSAATTISLISPLLNTLVTLTAGSTIASKVSGVISQVTTDLNNTAAMLSGAELNQLLMPAKFGAVLCSAATVIGAMSRAASPEIPVVAAAVRQSATMEAEAANIRGVMEVSSGVALESKADLALRIE